jgi:glycosyltransferase involved in cell wall biosynthesis
MKILHIWDVSGVANTIAKFMDRTCGTQSKVIVRKTFDTFGFNTQGEVISGGRVKFATKCLLAARSRDLIHVHSWDAIIPWVKRFYDKPVVFTNHSLLISKTWEARVGHLSEADAVTVVTESFSRDGTTMIPNPVDTDLFYDQHQHVTGTALHREYSATEEAETLARRYGLKLTIIPKAQPVKHNDLPALLNKHEYFVDVRRVPAISPDVFPVVSKMALEALACGCKVISWDGRVFYGLPEENRPENVVRMYFDLYQRLLDK